ncbi:hypothetical protein [Mycoplasma putrefaciens]|uniref:Lipoprotein n=1 Tax=Mycoplasma putrefaciens Mput9231 TaxID=1292033 RepID=M9WHA3_9MOLU|nr:hypothetical protein [Mycoplasma putrefaciens]AGJ90769.1 Hypothetical protein, predicted lipoprotein [Mycoplasma putrefaciens Mput9231]
MKKMLSLLTTITVIGATSSFVLSCQSSKQEYKMFEQYLNESKNKTLILYLGAKNNNSSISFEEGLKEITGAQNFSEAINKVNTTQTSDSNSFISQFKSRLSWNVTTNPTNNLIEVNVKKEKLYSKQESKYNEYWIRTDKKEQRNDNKRVLYQNMQNEVLLKGISYNRIQDQWESGITKKIIDDWLMPNLAKQFYGYGNDQKITLERITTVTEKVNNIANKVKELKGPIFMVLRDGMFYGAMNGFETFANYSKKESEKTIDSNTDKKLSKQIRDKVFAADLINHLVKTITQYNSTELYNRSETDLAVFSPNWHHSENGQNDSKNNNSANNNTNSGANNNNNNGTNNNTNTNGGSENNNGKTEENKKEEKK